MVDCGEERNTNTGTIAATVKPPRPYQSFGHVFATGIPNTWVAGAQPWHPVRDDNSAQPSPRALTGESGRGPSRPHWATVGA